MQRERKQDEKDAENYTNFLKYSHDRFAINIQYFR